MIGLDTNVLLRWLIDETIWPDDAPGQIAAARRLIEQDRERFFINHVVLAETVWVLAKGLKRPREEVVALVRALLAASNVEMDREAVVKNALADFEALPGDFADHLIGALNAEAGCRTTYTFDRKAGRSDRFTSLRAEEP